MERHIWKNKKIDGPGRYVMCVSSGIPSFHGKCLFHSTRSRRNRGKGWLVAGQQYARNKLELRFLRLSILQSSLH